MTTNRQARVTPLRRPPVRQEVLIRSGIDHTFAVFVDTIGAWWPVQPFSAGRKRVRDVTVERRVGGQVYETWEDGTIVTWGQLLRHRLGDDTHPPRCRRNATHRNG